ncbi:dihydrofolate reductase family protein [Microbacterium sulfonylureivorans]|uniref:dihydrofolate reductase family protein n=1 Tax=Microbacterium sulfonylureivorans TaxID=2486854 RepID=UPI000FDB8BBC|nr:dihydrofolate reductase family protein [Microbacterium sulfonylureivorans]
MGSTVIFVSVSVDGYATGPHGDLTRLHRWLSADARADDDAAVDLTARFRSAGAIVFGRRTWDSGQEPWGDDDVFDSPVFVMTHEERPPEAKNGTVFTFVSGAPADALELARAAAGDRDVVIMGSPDVAGQFLRDGLVDELLLHLVPVLLGGGTRLFGELPSASELELRSWVPGDEVSALGYAVVPRA